MATIASLIIDIGANTATLRRDVEQVNGTMSRMETVAGTVGRALVGAFSVTAIASFGRQVLEAGNDIQKMADQTGLSISQVQKLQYVAGQSDTAIGSLVSAIQNLQQRLGDESTGAAGAMAKLGIETQKFQALDSYTQMTTLASAIKNIKDPSDQASAAAALFGKTWKEILPAIKAGMVEVGDQAPIMADETVKSLDRIGDALTRAKMQWISWGGTAITAIEKVGYFLGGGFGTDITLKRFADENDPTGLLRALDKIAPAAMQSAAGLHNLDTVTHGFSISAAEAAEVEKKLTRQITDSIRANKDAAAAMAERRKEIAEMERQTPLWAAGMFNMGGADLIEAGRIPMPTAKEMLPSGEDFTRYLAGISPNIVSSMHQIAETSGVTFKAGIAATLAGVPQLITRAFTGGGGMSGAMAALGGQMADALAAPLIKKIGSLFGGGGGGGAGGKGGLFEGIGAGSIAAGIGTMGISIGTQILINWAKGIGKATEAELAGRSESDRFTSSLESSLDWMQKMEVHQLIAAGNSEKWSIQIVALNAAYAQAGHTADEVGVDINRLWEAEKLGGNAVALVLDSIAMKLHDTVPAFDDVAAAGATAFTEIAAEATKVEEATTAMYQRLLQLRGFSGGSAGEGTSEGRNVSGLLAGLSAAQAKEAYLSGIANTGSTGQDWERVKSQYGFAGGSGGMRNFGAGTMAMLHGREEVRTERQAKDESGLLDEVRRMNATQVQLFQNLPRMIRDQLQQIW